MDNNILVNAHNVVRTAKDILKLKIKEIPKLIDPYFPQVAVGAVCGTSDVGKSYFALALGMAICSDDREFLMMTINRKHKSVVMISTEDSEEDLCVRLTGFINNPSFDADSFRFILEPNQKNFHSALEIELTSKPADLVLIDTFGDLFDGNLNNSIEVRKFLFPYKKIATKFKCLILFLHHIGKGKEDFNAPSKNHMLGSQAIEAVCRLVFDFRKKADNKRVLTVVKGNNIPEEQKHIGMIIEFDKEKGFINTGNTIQFKKEDIDPNELLQPVDEVIKDYYPKKASSYQKMSEILKEKGYRKIDKNAVGKIVKKLGLDKIDPSVKTDEKMTDG